MHIKARQPPITPLSIGKKYIIRKCLFLYEGEKIMRFEFYMFICYDKICQNKYKNTVKGKVKGMFTLTVYICVFQIAMHFRRGYLDCSKQSKLFKNATLCGKCLSTVVSNISSTQKRKKRTMRTKTDVATRLKLVLQETGVLCHWSQTRIRLVEKDFRFSDFL